MLWRSIGCGRTIDTIRNIIDEASVIDGIKRTIKEDICEDNPIGKAIYEAGSYDGKKSGYFQASEEYEKKLLEQADLFLKQKRVFQTERVEYEELLDQYAEEIERLEVRINKTEVEKEYLQELLIRERNLKKLVIAE